MEIAGIETIQTLKAVGPKEAIQTAHVGDTINISTESKKRAEWVEMLKQMPDIRPEKIAEARHVISSAELAHRMIQSGF